MRETAIDGGSTEKPVLIWNIRMSDNRISVIPEDPGFLPDIASQNHASGWLERITPNADSIEIKTTETIEFFDCGTNFERILCPTCGIEISVEWWQQRMDDDYDNGFKLQKYPTPCCKTHHTLHDLKYEWPQGYGRFAMILINPGIAKLSDAQTRKLEQLLSCKLRIIYQHL